MATGVAKKRKSWASRLDLEQGSSSDSLLLHARAIPFQSFLNKLKSLIAYN